MVTTDAVIKTWGRWQLHGNNLVIMGPKDFPYRVPVADLQNGLGRFWNRQLSIKRWTNVQDMLDFRQAFKELTGRRPEW